MSTVHISCPSCQNPLVLDISFGGKKVQCPKCSFPIEVPENNVVPAKTTEEQTKERTKPQQILESGKKQASEIIQDLRQISFKKEIVPIDQSNIQKLLKDFVFWAVTLLGIIPLLIVTVNETYAQLTLFALFFAMVWGVILKKFVLNDPGPWRLPVASLFFTGVLGIWLILLIYKTILPDFYLRLPDSQNTFVSLFGFIFQVGIWEEAIKVLPLFIVIKFLKLKLSPLQLVTIGVFSGLGFAAFENLHYGDNAVASAYSLTRDYGVEGLVSGVQNAMVITMLRAVSLVFCHAVWSGIVSYFIATAVVRKEKVVALIITGLMVAAVLHGVYDWLAGIQSTMAALLAGFSFALFYGYLIKLQNANPLHDTTTTASPPSQT